MKHWTNDELIAHLYGAGPDDGHAGNCPQCANRIQELDATRKSRVVANGINDDEITDEELAAQRRAIYTRLRRKPEVRRRWVPALAAAAVVLVALIALRPRPEQVSDQQFLTEIAALAEAGAPRAAEPIHALFEEPKP